MNGILNSIIPFMMLTTLDKKTDAEPTSDNQNNDTQPAKKK